MSEEQRRALEAQLGNLALHDDQRSAIVMDLAELVGPEVCCWDIIMIHMHRVALGLSSVLLVAAYVNFC